tara:strand:- start:33 stop:236 length:204 start_codon:yes stop_codon:yes gene_type:complete
MTNNDQILEMIKDRLDIGAKKYGEQVPIDGTRDNLKESIEELLDLCVYLSAVALELHKNYTNNERGK